MASDPTIREEQPPRVPTAAGSIQDHRPRPRGVLPRQVQMWIMAGLALLIVGIIVLTGHPEQPRPPQAANREAPSLAPPDRIRSYQQELADRQARQQRSAVAPTPVPATPPAAMPEAQAVDPLGDERRRREYQSLFAENVAFTRRGGAQAAATSPGRAPLTAPAPALPTPEELAAFQRALMLSTSPPDTYARAESAPPAAATGPTAQAATPSSGSESRDGSRGETTPVRQGLRILEGTLIEAVLLNRLDGTFSGPVACLVTTPVYSEDRQRVLIPAGSRLLGAASPVRTWGDSRLAVSFHRLVVPGGDTHSLDQFKGLNQIGETGLKDQVNRHYLRVFGASLAIGALSGLAQYNTRTGLAPTFGDAYRQSAGASLAESAGRVLDRYLNVLPTITIREGHRIKVYITDDLYLPAHADRLGGSSANPRGPS